MIYALIGFGIALVGVVLFEVMMLRADIKENRRHIDNLDGNVKDAVHYLSKAAKAIDDDRHTRFAEQLATELAAYKKAQEPKS